MVVLSNHRLGPTAELLVSREAAAQLLREVAAAAGPAARARWEHELVTWLERCAASGASFDVRHCVDPGPLRAPARLPA